MRAMIDAVRDPARFSRYRLIRFSPDPIVDDAWFHSAEVSIFGGANSLDIQAIARPDGSYDVVICSHVLEHVKDDTKAIAELVRILSPEGFLVLAVPRTETGEATEDWGFADPVKNFHYRGYGRDFDARLKSVVPGVHVLAQERADPVTGDTKRFHVLTKSRFWRDRFLASGIRVAEASLV
jgi:2-polyprenyl-3-methyl-5-hydroxy-6-metoxy-1,4-benzoquinol methylase